MIPRFDGLSGIVAEKSIYAGSKIGTDFRCKIALSARVYARFLAKRQKVIFATECPWMNGQPDLVSIQNEAGRFAKIADDIARNDQRLVRTDPVGIGGNGFQAIGVAISAYLISGRSAGLPFSSINWISRNLVLLRSVSRLPTSKDWIKTGALFSV